MYFALFDLLHQHLYGLDTVLTPDMNLTLTIMATMGVVFVAALPFVVVWRVLKLFL